MKASEIEDFIVNSHEIKDAHCVLFDGPWGCGKTTTIFNVIKRLSEGEVRDIKEKRSKGEKRTKSLKAEVYYVSVCGFESILDIQEALRRKEYQKILKVGETAITIIRLVKPFMNTLQTTDFIPELADCVTEFFDGLGEATEKFISGLTESPKKKVLCVFDDLERLSTNVKYSAFLGFVEQLKSAGNKVFCLANSKEILNFGGRVKEWNSFYEKCFDVQCFIDDTDDQVYSDITGVKDESVLKRMKAACDNNYRIAFRAKVLADRAKTVIAECVKNGGEPRYDLTDDDWLLNCGIACNCLAKGLDKDGRKKIMGYFFGEEELKNAVGADYDIIVRVPGTRSKVVDALINYSLSNKTAALVRNDQDEVLPFYMSDDSRLKRKCDFVKAVKDRSILKKDWHGLHEFFGLQNSLSPMLSAEEEKAYFDLTRDTILNSKDDVNYLRDRLIIQDNSFYFNDKLRSLCEELIGLSEDAEDALLSRRMVDNHVAKRYGKLMGFIQEYFDRKEAKKRAEITEKTLKDHSYFLPDFSSDMPPEGWSYVLRLFKHGLKNESFMKEIKSCVLSQRGISSSIAAKEKVIFLGREFKIKEFENYQAVTS